MKHEMKNVVFEEMFLVTGGRIPADPEDLTEAAHQSQEIAVLLPVYMYYFHPHEWLEYTLFTDDSLPSALNHAAYIALDAPSLHADKQIKRFFYGAAAITRLPENHQTTMPVEDWTYYIFRQYYQLHQKTRFVEKPVNVRSRHSGGWFVQITK